MPYDTRGGGKRILEASGEYHRLMSAIQEKGLRNEAVPTGFKETLTGGERDVFDQWETIARRLPQLKEYQVNSVGKISERVAKALILSMRGLDGNPHEPPYTQDLAEAQHGMAALQALITALASR